MTNPGEVAGRLSHDGVEMFPGPAFTQTEYGVDRIRDLPGDHPVLDRVEVVVSATDAKFLAASLIRLIRIDDLEPRNLERACALVRRLSDLTGRGFPDLER